MNLLPAQRSQYARFGVFACYVSKKSRVARQLDEES